MNKKKIFNDTIYGIVEFDHDIIYQLIDHPYFQRLRRIKQMGFSDYVYPGAVHTRFQHSLGALYLVREAVNSLKWKGIQISDEEYEAVSIAVLLHDLGHGPFSHSLERVLIPLSHEEISLKMMDVLNKEMHGRLELAIDIYKGNYKRKFFSQLIAGQLDVDRLDYLNRDSYYTGVIEGKVGYDRLIKMLNVVNDELVVEEKAIYSVERFFMARKMMYWQVYLHKTSIVVDKMLHILFKYIIEEAGEKEIKKLPDNLKLLVDGNVDTDKKLEKFIEIDDSDIIFAVKQLVYSDDKVISLLSRGILNRKLLKIKLTNDEISSDHLELVRLNVRLKYGTDSKIADWCVFTGKVSNSVFESFQGNIRILLNNGQVESVDKLLYSLRFGAKSVKNFVLFPYY